MQGTQYAPRESILCMEHFVALQCIHRKFALFCMPYYLRHSIEIFSDYSLLLDVTVLVWKLKNIMQSTVKLTF